MGDHQTGGIKIKVLASFTDTPIELEPIVPKFELTGPEQKPAEPKTETDLYLDPSKLAVQKPYSNLNAPPSTPPVSLWKWMKQEEMSRDVVQIRVEDYGAQVLFFEKYPKLKLPEERPFCDPVIRCAGTLSLLRVTWR